MNRYSVLVAFALRTVCEGEVVRSSDSALAPASSVMLVADANKAFCVLCHTLAASDTEQCAIDNHIGRAMDVAKNHIVDLVRCELDELRTRISALEDLRAQLKAENDFLRQHVAAVHVAATASISIRGDRKYTLASCGMARRGLRTNSLS